LKPKHIGGYSGQHVRYCEQTLVTLLHRMGPWKQSVFLAGGLVPRYLFPDRTHAGTTDVDLVVSLDLLAETEAYRTLEENLKAMGFTRTIREGGAPVHWQWRKVISESVTVLVELLCEQEDSQPGRAVRLPKESRLSALNIRGVGLVEQDFVDYELRAELLDEGGVAIETIRVAGIAAFLVLKARAYGDRAEEKDAYDLVYCLMAEGPESAAAKFVTLRSRVSEIALLDEALAVLSKDFSSDEFTEGYRKNGPVSYARFLTDPGAPDRNVRHQRDASGVVEAFLEAIHRAST
jgi:hypothetical protein